MKAPVGLSFLWATTVACAQTSPTLAEYLKAHPEEAGLTVAAENRKPEPKGLGLSRYNRKRVQVGGLAALVPLNMIRIDDSLAKPPNLYDGLPRSAKALYLMSTLNALQWRTAAGKGIGLGDLQGEQRAVFLSLLPKTLNWRKVLVTDKRSQGATVEKGTLDEKAVEGVRLRFERGVSFWVPLASQPNAYTSRSPDDEAGLPGQQVLFRDNDDNDSRDTFGVEVRSTVPNVPKKSQLDTSKLDQIVNLRQKSTIGEDLSAVGLATRHEILADYRIRDLSVSLPGGKARAGDLLDALAWAVEGAYRKVDSTYLLVDDAIGMGARKLRLTMWKEEAEAEVQRRQTQWQENLAKTRLADAAQFDPNDPLSPSESIQQRLGKSPFDPSYNDFYSVNELSPAQRAFLERQVTASKNQVFSPDKVRVDSSLRYRFILPDGRALQSEGYLGADWQFRLLPPRKTYGPDPLIPIGKNADGALRPLAVHLSTIEEAKQAVETAKIFGFSELWVETDRAEILTAAIADGLPTRLFARPWALAIPRPDSDKTVLGETGRTVAARQAASSSWADFSRMVRMQAWPRLQPILVDGDLMSPFDPQWTIRRNSLAALARTPGIAGIVLNEAMPRGYEASDDTATVGAYRRSIGESWGFGYDERERLAFFRAKAVDPLDLNTEGLHYDVELGGAFFPRYPSATGPSVDALYEDWNKFRAEANLKALIDLRNAMPNLPILIDVRRAVATQYPVNNATIAPWPKGEAPPSYTEQYIPEFEGGIPMISAPSPRKAEAFADFANGVRYFAPRPAPRAIDLTQIPSAQWNEILGHCLGRKSP